MVNTFLYSWFVNKRKNGIDARKLYDVLIIYIPID